MQNSLQTVEPVETIETAVSAPVELTTEQLQLVGGGLVANPPHDNW